MNRTLGNPDYTVFKPWVQLPSNCVAPTQVVENWYKNYDFAQYVWNVCGGLNGLLNGLFGPQLKDPATGQLYDVANYPELNGGAGFYTDLKGKELPNRSEEHTSELQSLMRISYAVFCLKKQKSHTICKSRIT